MIFYIPKLNQKPKVYSGEAITQFTEGDLHANTIRLLESLVHYAIIDIKKEYYQSILDRYNKALSQPSDADNNKFLCGLLKQTIRVKNKQIRVRLLGDTLADRTGNDLFTLTVFSKLVTANANLHILLSNHDVNFITSVLGANTLEELQSNMRNNPFFSINAQGVSFVRLVDSLERGEITFKKLKRLSQEYMSTLFLLDYALDTQGSLKIFSHAPINLSMLNNLSKQFEVAFLIENASHTQIIQFIDAINAKLRSFIQAGNAKLIETIFDSTRNDSPASQIIWNREPGHQFIPKEKNIINIYGHDKQLPESALTHTQVIRLDNRQGKGDLRSTNEPTSVATQDS